jgi:hypothetical protein
LFHFFKEDYKIVKNKLEGDKENKNEKRELDKRRDEGKKKK